MSKSAQLKRKAAEFEQKRQYDRALAAYSQAIEAATGIPDELDIPLYNRVGDLHLRLGDLDKAVQYYETAVDLYAEGGFFNNAIALCNKVLRHAPGRNVIYYKLGKISAKKGFNSDAKQNFLEYASRMERAGDINESFRALKEFADLCPGQDDVRLMLAEQLARADRTTEALEQLQTVYDTMIAEDRATEAAATLDRIRALDPSFAPRTGASQRQQKREGLVFIDVDYERPNPDMVSRRNTQEINAIPVNARPIDADSFDAVPLPPPADVPPRKTLDDTPLEGLTPLEDPFVTLAEEAAHPGATHEFEPTAFAAEEPNPDAQPLAIEHTSFDVVSPASFSPTHEAVPPAEDAEAAWPAEADTVATPASVEHPDVHAPSESFSETLTGYLGSLSSDVGAIEGGLPDDLALIPPEAIAEQQQRGLLLPHEQLMTPDDDYVDLNEWLREAEHAKSSGVTGGDEAQNEDAVQTDFTRMLETFKAGVAANVDDSDSQSHYDLGVAYMEMGLLDEAIGQFQSAIRTDPSPDRRMRAYESLGQSFIEKGDCEVALNSLGGAIAEFGVGDARLIGVLYLLGYASECLGKWRDAESYYRRVFAVDIHFRDIGERLRRAEQMQ